MHRSVSEKMLSRTPHFESRRECLRIVPERRFGFAQKLEFGRLVKGESESQSRYFKSVLFLFQSFLSHFRVNARALFTCRWLRTCRSFLISPSHQRALLSHATLMRTCLSPFQAGSPASFHRTLFFSCTFPKNNVFHIVAG